MSDPRAEAIAEQVRVDLLDQLHDLQKHGRRYIEEYVGAYLGPKTTWRPRPAFHPKLAELIRELASEAAITDRRSLPSVQPVSSASANNDRPLTVKEFQ